MFEFVKNLVTLWPGLSGKNCSVKIGQGALVFQPPAGDLESMSLWQENRYMLRLAIVILFKPAHFLCVYTLIQSGKNASVVVAS